MDTPPSLSLSLTLSFLRQKSLDQIDYSEDVDSKQVLSHLDWYGFCRLSVSKSSVVDQRILSFQLLMDLCHRKMF